MSVISLFIDMGCDGCGAHVRVLADKPMHARRKLRVARWLIAKGEGGKLDYCPACAQKIRDERLKRGAARQRARVAS